MILHAQTHQDVFIDGRRDHYIVHHIYLEVSHFSSCGSNSYLEEKYNLPKLLFRIKANISTEMWEKLNSFGDTRVFFYIEEIGETFCTAPYPELKNTIQDYEMPIEYATNPSRKVATLNLVEE